MIRTAAGLVLALAFLFQNDGGVRPAGVEELYPSGALKARYSTDESGRRNGPFVEYHETGLPRIRTSYRAGELDGLYESMDERGAVVKRANYQKGQLHGAYYEKDETGEREVKAGFKLGLKSGKIQVLEKRKVISTQEWRDGELLEIEGIRPFPKSLQVISDTLRKIESLPPQEGYAADDLRLKALRRLQQFRFLCDVPYDAMVLDSKMNELCEAGAKLCKAIGRLDHTPANPGLPDAEYKRGYEGTSHSNLCVGSGMPASVDSYMDDSDPSNVGRVGHRRWCLNPQMLKTGFGAAPPYSAMWSMDRSRTKVPPIDYVSYPARGYMPREFFRSNTAWSITSASAKFAARSKEKVRIAVRALDEWYAPWGPPLPLSDVNVDLGGFGGAPCLIFRPKGAQNAAGSKYWAEISVDGDDSPEIRFLVEFVSLPAK
ncbi:MAG: hypothetical protein JNJ88_04025 [Planctomycetes bacterium]|nr:hypothetical protein [Planctomycetota bacterium]